MPYQAREAQPCLPGLLALDVQTYDMGPRRGEVLVARPRTCGRHRHFICRINPGRRIYRISATARFDFRAAAAARMSKAHPPELKKFMDKRVHLRINGGREVAN